ncbi:hypothetical protein ACHAXR_010566 [Thalassiosira sp. AJA248-18]
MNRSAGNEANSDRHKLIVQYMEAGDRAKSTLNYQEASKMYEEAVNFQNKAETQTHLNPPRVEPSIKLGVCLCELARYKEAEDILTRCLEVACDEESKVEMDEALYVRALAALAALYQAQSKYDAAIKLHEKAIPIARTIQVSQTSLCLADYIAGYAETLRKSGDLPQAERYHREAQAIRTRAVEHNLCTELELAVSYTQLGCTLAGMQQHKEAHEQHHRALTLRYRYLDFSHGLVSESLNYCAESLCGLGRGREGIPLALHAVQIRKTIFGESHPAYAHALSVLASCYHAVGRSCDACDCLEKCLAICEVAFPRNHANLIPNLMSYGSALCSTGNLKNARSVYKRAIDIHQLNFKDGQNPQQLKKCKAEMDSLTERVLMERMEEMDENDTPSLSRVSFSTTATTTSCKSCGTDMSVLTAADIESKGTPVIVFTDIGRDVDDEMALVLLSSLKRKHMLNPIAVVTTLSPEKDRAHLARGSLDTMGMADVPVGVGGRGGVADGVELEVYEADHTWSSPSIHESGMDLACQALESVPSKSAQILCLASLSDMALLIQEHQDLFTDKVKEVVVMGGVMPMDSGDTLTPDTAYNNNCDMESAKFVYEKCQELGVPTATLSRWAAYGCPIRPQLLDELAKTKHMVAANIRRKSKDSLDQLWNKVILPPDHPKREKLPARCDVNWFYKTFCGTDEVPEELPLSIWLQVEKLNMYDPLAVLICVSSYRDEHFTSKTKTVNRIPHVVVGTSESDTGVSDRISLYKEYSHLFINALQASLHEPEMPLGSEKEPDILIEETTKIMSARSRAA